MIKKMNQAERIFAMLDGKKVREHISKHTLYPAVLLGGIKTESEEIANSDVSRDVDNPFSAGSICIVVLHWHSWKIKQTNGIYSYSYLNERL